MKRRKLKILIFSNNYYPFFDGISVYTNNLIEQLKNKGHTVHTINFDKEFSKKNFSFKDILPSDATKSEYYSLKMILNPKNIFDSNKGLRNYIFTNMVYRISTELINKYKPDLIHATYSRIFPVTIKRKLPVIVTAHSEEIKNDYPSIQFLDNANTILCISKYTGELINKINTKYRNKIKIIHNSISVNKFVATKTKNKKDIIISVARLSMEKNLDTSIKAFANLPKHIINKYNYLIIGDGNQREMLKNLIKKYNIKNVELIGNVNEEEKIKYLNKARIFLLCPRKKKNEQEGFGIAFLEAQAANLPIITSNIGGIKEAVSNSGIYVEDPEDHIGLSFKLNELIDNTKMQKKLIESGQSRINTFDHSYWISKIEDEYYKLLKI